MNGDWHENLDKYWKEEAKEHTKLIDDIKKYNSNLIEDALGVPQSYTKYDISTGAEVDKKQQKAFSEKIKRVPKIPKIDSETSMKNKELLEQMKRFIDTYAQTPVENPQPLNDRQKSFLVKLIIWGEAENVSKSSLQVLMRVVKNCRYDERERRIINEVKNLYIKDMKKGNNVL